MRTENTSQWIPERIRVTRDSEGQSPAEVLPVLPAVQSPPKCVCSGTARRREMLLQSEGILPRGRQGLISATTQHRSSSGGCSWLARRTAVFERAQGTKHKQQLATERGAPGQTLPEDSALCKTSKIKQGVGYLTDTQLYLTSRVCNSISSEILNFCFPCARHISSV